MGMRPAEFRPVLMPVAIQPHRHGNSRTIPSSEMKTYPTPDIVKSSERWHNTLSGLTPMPTLATMLVAAAFMQANLAISSVSTPYCEYGFPLTYRTHFFRPSARTSSIPAALTVDIVLAVLAVASSFVATRRWSGLIGRYQRFTVQGLMATVAFVAIVLAVVMNAPLLALLMLFGCLIYGLSCIPLVLITFDHRTWPQAGQYPLPRHRGDDRSIGGDSQEAGL